MVVVMQSAERERERLTGILIFHEQEPDRISWFFFHILPEVTDRRSCEEANEVRDDRQLLSAR